MRPALQLSPDDGQIVDYFRDEISCPFPLDEPRPFFPLPDPLRLIWPRDQVLQLRCESQEGIAGFGGETPCQQVAESPGPLRARRAQSATLIC